MRLEGKTAIITGGSSGIGEAIVKKFLQNGAKVYVLDLNDHEAHSGISFHKCDVSHHEEIHKVISDIVEKDNIEILVNNAGVAAIGDLENTSEEDFDRLFRINVKGIYNCLHACLPVMVKNGGGAILNMASVAASTGISESACGSGTSP